MGIAIQMTQKDGWEIVHYVGPIDEEAEVHLAELLKRLGPKCLINFRQVTHVNSCGVRGWINFMREASKGREIVFEECTPEIVMQINMIPSFQGTAKIRSVYATYACDKCANHENVLFEEGRNLPEGEDDPIPAPKCSRCGAEVEMEELEEEYFAFVAA